MNTIVILGAGAIVWFGTQAFGEAFAFGAMAGLVYVWLIVALYERDWL